MTRLDCTFRLIFKEEVMAQYSIGDVFKVKENGVVIDVTYTITNIDQIGARQNVVWTCIGRRVWMKRVTNFSYG